MEHIADVCPPTSTKCGTGRGEWAERKSAAKCGSWSLSVPQIFFLSVHFCIKNCQMWQRNTLPLLGKGKGMVDGTDIGLCGYGEQCHLVWAGVMCLGAARRAASQTPWGKGVCMALGTYLLLAGDILASLKPCRSPHRQHSGLSTVSPVTSGQPPETYKPYHRCR